MIILHCATAEGTGSIINYKYNKYDIQATGKMVIIMVNRWEPDNDGELAGHTGGK